jgi:cyclase
MKKLPAFRPCAIIPLTLLLGITTSAQYTHPNAPNPNDGMSGQLVKTGLYVFSGQGSNSVLRLSANGLILVDGKLPGNYDALLARINRIVKQPVRALILTDGGSTRTGTNAQFLEHGTQIIAQENTKQYLASYNSSSAKVALPTITYTNDYKLRMGGVEVQLFHFGNAYTDGDTVVYFPNLKAIAVGELFTSTPTPDFSAGGSLVGWGGALAQVLKLDFDVVVPGNGPPVTRADLEAFKTKIDTLISRATGLVNKGVPKDQLMAQLKTDDLGWKFNLTGKQLDDFYRELSRTK